ncbi:MAG: sugar ABC transporter substrate-binding protein [Pyramidobacter sp.]|nr:sugar ABC transporter substrate-binding protein [Pyramidobacter sp.]
MTWHVGILFGDQENPFWQEQMLWYRKFLPEYPFRSEMFFTDPPRDISVQAGLCQRLLTCGLDALIVNPLDSQELAREAAGAHTDCVMFDVGPKCDPKLTCVMSNYVPLPVCSFREQGRLCASELLKQSCDATGSLACIGGPESARQGRGRVEGALAAAADAGCPTLPVVWSDFTREGGYRAAKQLLSAAPRAVFCANDLMALGVSDLIEERKLNIPVGGVDLIPSAVFAVRNGTLAATVGPRGEDIVRGVLTSVQDYLERQVRPKGYLAQNVLVTAEILRKKQQSGGLSISW